MAAANSSPLFFSLSPLPPPPRIHLLVYFKLIATHSLVLQFLPSQLGHLVMFLCLLGAAQVIHEKLHTEPRHAGWLVALRPIATV